MYLPRHRDYQRHQDRCFLFRGVIFVALSGECELQVHPGHPKPRKDFISIPECTNRGAEMSDPLLIASSMREAGPSAEAKR